MLKVEIDLLQMFINYTLIIHFHWYWYTQIPQCMKIGVQNCMQIIWISSWQILAIIVNYHYQFTYIIQLPCCTFLLIGKQVSSCYPISHLWCPLLCVRMPSVFPARDSWTSFTRNTRRWGETWTVSFLFTCSQYL